MMILTVITLAAVLYTAAQRHQWGVLILLLVGVATWGFAGSIPASMHVMFIGVFVATWQLLRNKPMGVTHEKSNHPA